MKTIGGILKTGGIERRIRTGPDRRDKIIELDGMTQKHNTKRPKGKENTAFGFWSPVEYSQNYQREMIARKYRVGLSTSRDLTAESDFDAYTTRFTPLDISVGDIARIRRRPLGHDAGI